MYLLLDFTLDFSSSGSESTSISDSEESSSFFLP
jgi:hypothetical protein